ncbi:MAG: DNA polymerase III subunit beta [Magnetococcales bacterium]|nr:DNA polymerase III subunit beta [Magnetococcales bacterium]
MELHLDRDPFLKVLSRVHVVAERRSTMPILGNVLLEARDGQLTATATDLEVFVTTTIPAEVVEPGSITVAARKLYDIVKELQNNTVHLRETQGNRLQLQAGRARFTLAGISPDEYPAFPQEPSPPELTLPAAMLADMFGKTYFAMSHDESRFALSGLLLELTVPTEEEPGPCRIVLAATDTHRLAVAEQVLSNTFEEGYRAILPKKAVAEIRKMLEEAGSEQVTLLLGRSHVHFIREGTTLISKLVTGRFPNYRRVIPLDHPIHLGVDNGALQGMVRRMAVLSNEKSRGLQMRIETGIMRMNADNPEQELAEEEMDIPYEGPSLNLCFNARYLQEICSVVPGDVLLFKVKDAESPVLISDPTRGDFLYVLMPMEV